ncbi:MAG: hypothetical protein GKR95_00685 [Gammaproteobacteria bacterium]|nr:hypothetical protein [Gammaproteobacteria bacterium]
MKDKLPTITVREVNPEVKEFYRIKGAKNGRSMEAEIRAVLTWYSKQNSRKPRDVARKIHQAFKEIGGADDLVIPKREKLPEPITFSE